MTKYWFIYKKAYFMNNNIIRNNITEVLFDTVIFPLIIELDLKKLLFYMEISVFKLVVFIVSVYKFALLNDAKLVRF